MPEFVPGTLPPLRAETGETAESGTSGRMVRPPWQDGSRSRFRWVRPDSLDLALMDSSGRIQPVQLGPFPINEVADEQVQAVWQAKTKMTGVPATQEVTYMAFAPAEGERGPPPALREVIITPVTDPATLEVIGGLVVGLPVSTYGESALYDLNQRDKPGELQTGLWIEDRLVSRSIPRDVQKTVSSEIRSHLDKEVGEREESTVNINGVPHQMLYRCLNPDSPGPRSWQITLYSRAGLMAELAALRGGMIGFALLAFGAAVLVSWLIARRLVLPVRDLVSGTQRIKAGQYDTRVPVTTRDELATLAVSFNEMAEGLKQRQRYRDILFQVSDDDIARQLIETACLGGERREISVLFCDIREFTATTSGMAPEGVIDLLNEHMTALTEIVHRHHGVVDKFVGDLIMAIFGAPKSYGDDAGNAAACALEMVARREELNQTTAHPPLLMGIGIASGAAVAGCMGSENRLNYTVLGVPVNLASRLCSAAGPSEVILDPHTCSLLGARAQGHRLRALSLKGFPHPVEPFLLAGLGAAAAEAGMEKSAANVTAR